MARVYLTTTLPYVNDKPHMGHALEFVQADAIARSRRLMGDDVFFNTGTDEHGQKIADKALAAGKDPQTYTDEYAETFKALKEKLNLSYDAFIRTTDPAHKAAAQEFWKRCAAKGDIYKKKYATKYCVGCELEKTDSELDHGVCPIHPNMEVQVVDEENYFFRFSKYGDALLALYKSESFLTPHFRLNEMVSLIEKEGLQDFSISRLKSKMSWGVPVPGDDEHVMYVWFDALINYISTLGWPDEAKFSEFWREGETIQFAGKDQVRQQAAMWQAMLLSADLPPTKHIFIHGFIFVDGQKMSKSLGNVIDPLDMVAKYGTDATRYLLLRHINPFEDSDVTWAKFDEWYTANLANGLGNLTARVMKLAQDNLTQPVLFDAGAFSKEYSDALGGFEFNKAADIVWAKIQALDQRINAEEPFKLVKSDLEAGRRVTAELVHELAVLSYMVIPLMPATAEKILTAVRTNKKPDNLFNRLA
ncbi:MAG: methionine--tRNA ligase [Candidatus Pacebacteria bacterium]|nr:methionine--tRNA ligase [Candidatus Paceibacterota bacterium]